MYDWAKQGEELEWLILEDLEIVCQIYKLTISVLCSVFLEHILYAYEDISGFLGGRGVQNILL